MSLALQRGADKEALALVTIPRAGGLGHPPPLRTKWTRRVPHPVLIGHAASLSSGLGQPPPDESDQLEHYAIPGTSPPPLPTVAPTHVPTVHSLC